MQPAPSGRKVLVKLFQKLAQWRRVASSRSAEREIFLRHFSFVSFSLCAPRIKEKSEHRIQTQKQVNCFLFRSIRIDRHFSASQRRRALVGGRAAVSAAGDHKFILYRCKHRSIQQQDRLLANIQRQNKSPVPIRRVDSRQAVALCDQLLQSEISLGATLALRPDVSGAVGHTDK